MQILFGSILIKLYLKLNFINPYVIAIILKILVF